MSRKRSLTVCRMGILMLVALLAACTSHTVYHHYEAVSMTGWEKNDTVIFHVPPMTADGTYRRQLGLRVNSDYPFMGLTLIVEQTVMPDMLVQRDTLSCNIIDNHGHPYGHGVSCYQYQFPLPATPLQQGQSLRITIRHDMRREILPGITDIGVEISSQTPGD